MIKLTDYQSKKDELELSSNRFVQIMLAQLAVLEKGTPNNKLENKIRLTKRLYDFGWNKQDIFNLYRLIDWIIKLPAELEIQYNEIIETFEQEEAKMAYVTTAERIGIQKGKASLFKEMLVAKFKELPSNYVEKIDKAQSNILEKWALNFINAKTLDEVF